MKQNVVVLTGEVIAVEPRRMSGFFQYNLAVDYTYGGHAQCTGRVKVSFNPEALQGDEIQEDDAVHLVGHLEDIGEGGASVVVADLIRAI